MEGYYRDGSSPADSVNNFKCRSVITNRNLYWENKNGYLFCFLQICFQIEKERRFRSVKRVPCKHKQGFSITRITLKKK